MLGFNKSQDASCPLWRGPCKKHDCIWYLRLSGATADGEMQDHYDCAMVLNARLILESAQQSHQAGASSDKVASEIRKFHESMVDMNLRGLPHPDEQARIERSAQGR